MTKKVYPNTAAAATANAMTEDQYGSDSSRSSGGKDEDDGLPLTLTVWKKSLILNCTGFTVFDGKGDLVFRVDNYVAANRSRGEILLMDAAGTPLLTIRRKRLSWGDNWLVYDGEESVNPRYSVHKHGNARLLSTSTKSNNKMMTTLAQVFSLPTAAAAATSAKNVSNNKGKGGGRGINLYQIEGCYAQRNVVVYNNNGRRVAEIKRKEPTRGGVTLGADVFTLFLLRPHLLHPAFAMALVIILDFIFGSS